MQWVWPEGQAQVHTVVLDSAADGVVAGTRGVAEAADDDRLAQVYDQAVRMGGLGLAPLGVPVIGGLAVDGVEGGAVLC